MKAVAKQNCYFSCQLWYQRQAAKYHGSLSSFHIFHKSLLYWSTRKYWLWFRNALKYVLLKSASQSWTRSGRHKQLVGEVRRVVTGGLLRQEKEDGKMSLSARWSNFPLTEDYTEIACQESTDLTAVIALFFLHRTKVPTMVSMH